MNRRELQDLDRHITGNYGEDFFVTEPSRAERIERRVRYWRFGRRPRRIAYRVVLAALRLYRWCCMARCAAGRLLRRFCHERT